MAKRIEDEDGLTPPEAQACVYRATGLSQSEAYRRAFNVKRIKPETVWNKASKLFSRSEVQARVRELLSAAKVQDIISIGQWGEMVLDGARDARAADNWPAFANLTRQLGQAVGALKDNIALTVEQRTSDADLIEQLSGGDPTKLAALQTILGAPEGFGETRH